MSADRWQEIERLYSSARIANRVLAATSSMPPAAITSNCAAMSSCCSPPAIPQDPWTSPSNPRAQPPWPRMPALLREPNWWIPARESKCSGARWRRRRAPPSRRNRRQRLEAIHGLRRRNPQSSFSRKSNPGPGDRWEGRRSHEDHQRAAEYRPPGARGNRWAFQPSYRPLRLRVPSPSDRGRVFETCDVLMRPTGNAAPKLDAEIAGSGAPADPPLPPRPNSYNIANVTGIPAAPRFHRRPTVSPARNPVLRQAFRRGDPLPGQSRLTNPQQIGITSDLRSMDKLYAKTKLHLKLHHCVPGSGLGPRRRATVAS